jgi:fatty-acyl-CoA synthase
VDVADVSLQRLVLPMDLTALAGTHVCLRRVEAAAIYEAIAHNGVTHLCGAPVVMNMLLNGRAGAEALARPADRDDDRRCGTPAAVIEGMEGLGFHITHV